MPYGSNFSFVIDSSFQPFTLQEMLVPFAAYKEAFEKSEEDYMKLTNEADKFKYLSETLPEDSKARQLYEGYANGLRAQAEDLAHNGLTMGNRRALTDYKRRYQGEIGRIADAQERKRAQWDEQRKMLLQNPTMMYSRRADLTSLDDYLDNPDLSYESYNGALLSQQVSTAASAIAKSLRDYGHGKPLDKFTSTWLQQHGFTAAEVAAAINDPTNPNSSKILNGIVEQAIQSSGIPRWADKATMDQAYAYARQGLWSAVGETKVDKFENYGARLAAQEASQKRIAAHAAALQAAAAQGRVGQAFERRAVATPAEMAQRQADAKFFEKYGQYFYKDKNGTMHMNAEGMKKYSSTPYVYRGAYSTAQSKVDDEFKKWIDRNGLSEMAKGRTGKSQSDHLISLWNASQGRLDTTIATEYTGLIDSSLYDNVAALLHRASDADQKIASYERIKVKEGDEKGHYDFGSTGSVDVSKITGSDILSAIPVYGKHGNYLEVYLKNGTKITSKLSDLSPTYDEIIKGNMGDISGYEGLLAQGKEATVINGQIVPIDFAINQSLNLAHDNFMSALGSAKTEPRKIESGFYLPH